MTEALNYMVILCLLLGIKENWTGDFKQMFIMGKNGEKSEISFPGKSWRNSIAFKYETGKYKQFNI